MHAVVTLWYGLLDTIHTSHLPLPVQGYCTLQMWRALSGPDGVQQFSAWICALALESSPERRAFSRHGRQQYVGRDAVAALHAVSPVRGANTCNGTRVGRRGCRPCSLQPCRALHAALALQALSQCLSCCLVWLPALFPCSCCGCSRHRAWTFKPSWTCCRSALALVAGLSQMTPAGGCCHRGQVACASLCAAPVSRLHR